MILTGYARHIRANLSPAQIIDPAVFALGDPALLAAQCLVTVDPALAARACEGDLLVLAGTLTSDADPHAAVIALQAVGIAAVVCQAVAPELQAVAASYGLPILVAPEAATAISEGILLRIDLAHGQITAAGTQWACAPLNPPALASVRRAQLLVRMRRVVEEEGFAE